MQTFWSFAVLLSGLQLSQALNVYLNSQHSSLTSNLSPEDASSVLSRHLGVEVFEPLRDASIIDHPEEYFVGRGVANALLLTAEELDAQAVLPSFIKPSFTIQTPSPISSLSSIISTYLHRAQHTYVSIYDAGLSRQSGDVVSLSAFFKSAEGPSFAAIELKEIAAIRHRRGTASEEYIHATTQIRAFLEQAYNSEGLRIALLTFSPSFTAHTKRQLQSSQSPLPPNHPPPQEPIGSISTCFASADDCTNGTSSCSGRGKCVEATKSGQTCFVCTCGTTKTGEGNRVKTDTWVGQSCERKDVSGPFVLLAGTAIVMILLVFGSVSLLSSIGEHELPSTLLATAVNPKKD